MKMRARSTLFLLLAGGALQDGFALPERPGRVVYSYNAAGGVESATSYRDGRKVGRHEVFWPDGSPRVFALYAGDILEGEYRSWHANGVLGELKHYANGREDGIQKAWNDRGELFLNVEVRNGRRYGMLNAHPCIPVPGDM